MRYFPVFLIVVLLNSAVVFSQNTIRGTVFKGQDKLPAAYSILQLDSNPAVFLADQYGNFEINLQNSNAILRVSYPGFQEKATPVKAGEQYLIQIEKQRGKKTQALPLTAQEILTKAKNSPYLLKNCFEQFSYQKYSKLWIDKQLDPLQNSVSDNLNADPHQYLSEQVSQFFVTENKSDREQVLGSKTAGFDEPVYQILKRNKHSDSWNGKVFTVYGKYYASPLGKKAKENYRYELLGKTKTERPAYLIQFIPKRPKAVSSLNGVLFIDAENFGLQRVKAHSSRGVKIDLDQDFNFDNNSKAWLPKKTSLILKPGENGDPVKVYGGNIALGNLSESLGEKPLTQMKSMKIVTTYANFQFEGSQQLPPNEVQVPENVTGRSDRFWQKNRGLAYSQSDSLTTPYVDSIIEAGNYNRKIAVREKFNDGYYPLGFFDVNLRYLIKINNYEGLKLGFGGRTNEKFAENFRLESYLKYGFKDQAFKYSLGGGFRLDKEQPTWLLAHYTKDIYEVGKYTFLTDLLVYTLFEPRLVNIDFYYKYRSYDIDLQRQFIPGLQTELKLKRSEIEQTNTKPYSFRLNGQDYRNYNLSEAKLAIRWNPNSHFLKSPEKTIQLKEKYPIFSLQLTQAVDGVLGGDFDYTKIGAKIEYTVNQLNQSSTEFILEGDLGLGELPLTHAFHAYPNNPVKPTIIKRFSVAGRHSFETMYFNEFFSSKLASLHVKHYLRPFKITNKIKPQLVLITRHAIGDMNHIDRHQGFDFGTLDQGYSESGFELNKIFWGFGLSFAYRYGAYHLPELEDNISFKFTYYMSI